MISDMFVKQAEAEAEHFVYGDVPFYLAPVGVVTSCGSVMCNVCIFALDFFEGVGCGLYSLVDNSCRKDFWNGMKVCKHCGRNIGYSLLNICSLGTFGWVKSNLNKPSSKPFVARFNLQSHADHERINTLKCEMIELFMNYGLPYDDEFEISDETLNSDDMKLVLMDLATDVTDNDLLDVFYENVFPDDFQSFVDEEEERTVSNDLNDNTPSCVDEEEFFESCVDEDELFDAEGDE